MFGYTVVTDSTWHNSILQSVARCGDAQGMVSDQQSPLYQSSDLDVHQKIKSTTVDH